MPNAKEVLNLAYLQHLIYIRTWKLQIGELGRPMVEKRQKVLDIYLMIDYNVLNPWFVNLQVHFSSLCDS